MANFTGERPGWGKDFEYDESRHLAAYVYARGLASGLDVLDAGCGEGFGTRHLAEVARSVTGVDYSPDAVEACQRTWQATNLRFRQVDLTMPRDFSERFDLVLNFQVLEHIEDPVPFLQGLRDRLRPEGTLMLTTPNRLRSFSENPYHVREYTAPELEGVLGEIFGRVDIQGMHGNEKVELFDVGREKAVKRILRLDPFGLRNLLPSSLINFAFARLALVVRRSAKKSGAADLIVPEDFFVRSEDTDAALDLVALCLR